MFNRKAAVKTTIDSLIGAATRLDGNVVFQGGLRIDGHVRGDVVAVEGSTGLLVIGEHGRVEGNIVAGHLIVNGTVQGSIAVSGMIELQPKARISGEVRYRAVEVQRGALVEGIMSHFDGDLIRPELRLGATRDAPLATAPRPIVRRAPIPGAV